MNRPPHILVVDDDREIRTLLRAFLEKNGFAATAVADGEETRRALARGRFDLVVLDLMLPHESGLEICRELRATSDVPVIMLTALGEEVDRVVGFEVGAASLTTAIRAATRSSAALRARTSSFDRRRFGRPSSHDVKVARIFAGLGVALQDREAVQADLINLLSAVLGGLAELVGAGKPMNPEGHTL